MIELAAMSPATVTGALVGFALARLIIVIYRGSGYSCPVCGAKAANKHASGCPWRNRH